MIIFSLLKVALRRGYLVNRSKEDEQDMGRFFQALATFYRCVYCAEKSQREILKTTNMNDGEVSILIEITSPYVSGIYRRPMTMSMRSTHDESKSTQTSLLSVYQFKPTLSRELWRIVCVI